ncbi:MAG: hypothetical protein KDD35_07795, partial [Bdellovibrionales bacterium]|nr:hypothetical protein [Bdellovibrionales bacterium]
MKLYINLFFLFILLIGSPGISAKSILPVNGAIAKYQCKGGPTTERNVAYWTEKSDKIVFRDSWSRGIKGKLFEEDGLADSADFLIGIAQHWVLNRSFRSLKHLNGNLKKVISLEKGQYTGQLSVETSNKTYKAVATITIGDKSTVTSGMGSLLSVPIETKITNIDGKGGVLSISSQFSPALRLFTKKTVKGPRSDNFTNFVCELTATKIESEPKGSAKQLKFAWPEVGRKTSYSCVGTISRYSVEVLKNDGQTVTLKTISPFGIDILTGTPKQFYFGLASLADSRNIRSYD